MATCVATDILSADSQKLLVQFRTVEHCSSYIARTRTAHHLFSIPLAGKHAAMMTRSQQENVRQLLQYLRSIAAVSTENPDSLRRVLRCDSNVVHVWSPLRYRIDRMGRGEPPRPFDMQWYLYTLRAQQAWQYSIGSGVVVGVIDTGIDWEHPLLKNSLWVNPAEDINGTGHFEPWPHTEIRDGVYGDLDGLDNDGNGYADDVIGYSFVGRTSVDRGGGRGPFPMDENGHGTAVASLIVAQQQDRGMIGLAYGAKAMVLRAFNLLGIGDEDDIAAAIIYAAANGASVINCSFGDIVRSKLIAAAIEYARAVDVVVVASSGNSGSDLPHYPSDEVGVLSVGASNQANRPALFSSYGERLFILAPGSDILGAALHGGLDRFSGTSFAAALVSASVALLRAYDPSLNADQIRTILAQSASPITAAWERRSGHGVVSPVAALEYARSNGIVRITAPGNRVRLPQSHDGLEVALDVVHPLLERWEFVAIYEDRITTLTKATVAVANYRKVFTNVFAENDSTIVLRLRAVLRTGKTIEDAVVIERAQPHLALNHVRVLHAWHGYKRHVVLLAHANRQCELSVTVEQGRDTVVSISGSGEYRRQHAILLPPLHAGIYRLRVTAIDGADTVVTAVDSITTSNSVHASAEWDVQSYSTEPLLLGGSFVSTSGEIVATRAQYPQQGIVLKPSHDSFRVIARTLQTLFLRGYGDVNGDGRREVLTYDGGDTRVYTFEPVPFGSVLWGDTATHTFWAAAMADITKDGRVEILGFRTRRFLQQNDGTLQARSDALVAIGWQEGAFVVLDSIELASPPQAGRMINTISAPLCAVGDFDGDGIIEVAYADSDGELEIAAWKNARFEREYIAPPPPFLAGAGTEFVAAADVDGDGKAEILSGAPALPVYNTVGEYEPPLWRFVLFKAVAPDSYAVVWEDYFWDVHYGRPYYNGVAAGDLTGDRKDEIVLSLFPFAYVFSWRNGNAELLYVRDSVWSNGALITDLNRNGRNEVALTVGLVSGRTQFFEYAPGAYAAPIILDAYATPTAGIVCRWTSSPAARYYRLSVDGIIVAETSDTSIVLAAAAIPPCARCTLTVQAWGEADSSRRSLPAIVVRAEPLVLMQADTVFAGEKMLRVTTRGFLPANGIPPAALRVEKDGIRWNVQYTAANGLQELLAWLSQPLEEGVYRVHLSQGTLDKFGNPSPPSSVLLFVRPLQHDTPSFYIERIVEVSESGITVQFNEPPDVRTLQLEEIVVQPYGGVVQIVSHADSTVLRFILDSHYRYQPRGFVYTMTFPASFKSLRGRPINTRGGNTVAWFYSVLGSAATEAFPQPFSRSRHTVLRFSHVPIGAAVIVTTLDGVEIARIYCDDPTGGVQWTPSFPRGEAIPPGIYLYRIQLSNGTEVGPQKFVVVP